MIGVKRMIGGKRMIGVKRRLVENECRSPEGTKFRRMNGGSESKVVGKANVGANQKSSERQMWELNKSRLKGKCGWKTKVGRGDCPKSQTFLSENRESDSGLV